MNYFMTLYQPFLLQLYDPTWTTVFFLIRLIFTEYC
jgi:hypothetical protein